MSDPLVVNCSPVEVGGEIEPDIQAAILARRAERAPADDALRVAALEQVEALRARIARKLAAEIAKRS